MTTRISSGGDAPVGARPWTLLRNPGREVLEETARRLGLHPLVIEDLQAGRQQPKAEIFGDVLYLSIWDIDRHDDDATMTDTDLALILTTEELVLVQRGDGAEFRDLDALLRDQNGPVPADSPVSAMHRVLDAVVRDFVDLGASVEKGSMISSPRSSTVACTRTAARRPHRDRRHLRDERQEHPSRALGVRLACDRHRHDRLRRHRLRHVPQPRMARAPLVRRGMSEPPAAQPAGSGGR